MYRFEIGIGISSAYLAGRFSRKCWVDLGTLAAKAPCCSASFSFLLEILLHLSLEGEEKEEVRAEQMHHLRCASNKNITACQWPQLALHCGRLHS